MGELISQVTMDMIKVKMKPKLPPLTITNIYYNDVFLIILARYFTKLLVHISYQLDSIFLVINEVYMKSTNASYTETNN